MHRRFALGTLRGHWLAKGNTKHNGNYMEICIFLIIRVVVVPRHLYFVHVNRCQRDSEGLQLREFWA